MISQRIKDLIIKAADQKVSPDVWGEIERQIGKEIEAEAEKLEVTCDYYLTEFYQ